MKVDAKRNSEKNINSPKYQFKMRSKIKNIFILFLRICSFAKYNAGIINPLYAVTRPNNQTNP